MPESDGNIKKINNVSGISFFVIFLISFLICLGISLINVKFYVNDYNPFFYNSYILNNALLLFFQYFFTITLIYLTILYSFLIKKDYLITQKGKQVLFSKIIGRGFGIVIFLLVVFALGQELLVPGFENKIDTIRINTIRAKNLLELGQKLEAEGKYVESLSCFIEYKKIINSSYAKQKEIDLKSKVINLKLNEKKLTELTLSKEDTTIANTITDHFQLAEIYFQKHDYISAWYYYVYAKQFDKSKSIEAEAKIEKIKEVLKFQNSLKSDKDFEKYLSETDKKLRDIYNMKIEADKYMKENDYQKAFFIYTDILKINPTLRDVIQGQNESFTKLNSIAIQYEKIKNSEIQLGKKNVIFLLSPDTLITIGLLTKIFDSDKNVNTFYLYDVILYKIDENFNIKSVIRAPFGETKYTDKGSDLLLFTLYSYALNNRDKQYFPYPQLISVNDFEKIVSKSSLKGQETLYDSYSYEGDDTPYKAHTLNDESKKDIGKIVKESRINILELVSDKKKDYLDYIMQFPVDINIIYNFSYDYNKALNFSLIKLLKLKDFAIKQDKANKNQDYNFSIGFNNNFLKTAITDKISRIFLFFAVSLLIIAFAWKYRIKDYISFSLLNYIMLLLIPVFIYVIVQITGVVTTSFYSILAQTVDFQTMLIVCFVLNSIILISSVIVLAGSKN